MIGLSGQLYVHFRVVNGTYQEVERIIREVVWAVRRIGGIWGGCSGSKKGSGHLASFFRQLGR